MQIPGLQTLALREGVLPEPLPGNHGLVLWLRGEQRDGFLYWERVGNVANAAVIRQTGLCATPATAVRVRQRLRGFFGKLLGRFRAASPGSTWVLPGGEAAEQVGERQTDLLLVWPEGEQTVLDEAQLRLRWPHSQRIRQLGEHLFLVSGIAPPAGDPATTPRQWEPRQAAEALLAAARRSGDRRGEIAALTDLGIIHTRACAGRQALTVLEEALTLARQSGDPSLEADVVNHLGLAALTVGQPARALQLLEQGLAHARGTGDRFAEKGALDRLGEAYGRLRDPNRALDCYEQARMLAQELGDRQHAADLLWSQGIQYAELGQRDSAVARAEAAIALLRNLGNPQAGWLEEYLQAYRTGEAGERLGGGATESGTRANAPYGSQVIAGGWAGTTGTPAGGQQARGPGLLRMAIASVKSMATFLSSGLKTVPPVLHQQRVSVCATCDHHTGLRCKLCGCFTNAKAWLPHERCPVGKWSV